VQSSRLLTVDLFEIQTSAIACCDNPFEVMKFEQGPEGTATRQALALIYAPYRTSGFFMGQAGGPEQSVSSKDWCFFRFEFGRYRLTHGCP